MITGRHNQLCSCVATTLRELGIHGKVTANSAKSYAVPSPDDTGELEPGDVTVENCHNFGALLFIDVRVSDILAISHRDGTVQDMFDSAWKEKNNLYLMASRAVGADFTPLIVSQGGKVSPDSITQLNRWMGVTDSKHDDEDTAKTLTTEEIRRRKLKTDLLINISFICNLAAAKSLLEHQKKFY